MFDHGPQTGAMRIRSGACSFIISMTMCRPLGVMTSNPLRILQTGECTALTESGTNVDLPLVYTVPTCSLRDGCHIFHEHDPRRS